MSDVENEDDIDIYSNLPKFNYSDSLQKLEKENKFLIQKVNKLEKDVTVLTDELSKCRAERNHLAKNISSLYKSAKLEIIRKDKRIRELTEKNIASQHRRLFPEKRPNDPLSPKRKGTVLGKFTDNKLLSPRKKNRTIFSPRGSSCTFDRYHERKNLSLRRQSRSRSRIREMKCSSKDFSKPGSSKDIKKLDCSKKENVSSKSGSSKDIEKLDCIKKENVALECNLNSRSIASSKGKSQETVIIESTCVTDSKETSTFPYGNVLQNNEKTSTASSLLSESYIPLVESTRIVEVSSSELVENKFNVTPSSLNQNSNSENVQISQVESIQPVDIINESTNTKPPPELPPFTGPRTTFSMRKYKQLYGVSPFKKTPSSDQSSVLNADPSSISSKENLPKVKLFCDDEQVNNNSEKLCIESNSDKIVSEKDTFGRSSELNTSEDINKCNRDLRLKNVSNSQETEEDKSESVEMCVVDDVSLNTVENSTSIEVVGISLINNTTNEEMVCCTRNDNIINISNIKPTKKESDNKILMVSNDNKDTSVIVACGSKLSDAEEKDKNNSVLTADVNENKESGVNLGNVDHKQVPLKENSEINPDGASLSTGDHSYKQSKLYKNTSEILKTVDYNLEQNDENQINVILDEIVDILSENVIENQVTVDKSKDSFDEDNNMQKMETSLRQRSSNEDKDLHVNEEQVKIISIKSSEESKKNCSVETQEQKINNKFNEDTDSNSIHESCDSYTLEITMSPVPEGTEEIIEDNNLPEVNVHLPSITEEKIENSNPADYLNLQKQLQTKIIKTTPEKQQMKSPTKILPNLNSPVKSDLNYSGKIDCTTSTPISKEKCSPIEEKVHTVRHKKKDKRLIDLFGDSPLKIDDNSNSNKTSESNFNIFKNISLTNNMEIHDNSSNRQKESLNLSKNHCETASQTANFIGVETDKKILITPDTSKSYSNFKEAFQQSKSELIKSLDSEKSSSDIMIKSIIPISSISSNKNNVIDKENPSTPPISQKSSPVSSPSKNILGDKAQSDNITSINETKKTTNKFSPNIFGSEIGKSTDTRIENTLKISESSITLPSGEDSTINMIKAFSKIGEKISPIKTPCKVNESKNKSEVNDVKTFESKILTTNDKLNSDKKISNLKPIKTQYNMKNVQQENKSLNSQNQKRKVISEETEIEKPKCVISSSEHCEFKRTRQIQKIIKVDRISVKQQIRPPQCSDDSNKQSENIVTKADSLQYNDSNSLKRKIDDTQLNNEENVFGQRKKRKIVIINSNSSANTNPKEKQTRRITRSNQESISLNNDNNNSAETLTKEKTDLVDTPKKSKLDSVIDRLILKNSLKNKDDMKTPIDNSIKNQNVSKHVIKQSSSSYKSKGVCERRSPSEYFNRQHKSRIKDRFYNIRRSPRRPSSRSSPVTTRKNYCKNRKSENHKSDMELRSKLKKIKVEEDYKLYITTHKDLNLDKNKRRQANSKSGFDSKISESCNRRRQNTSDKPSSNICFPVKRLSESPNMKQIPQSAVKSKVLNKMPWKIYPLEIENINSYLVKKFITCKAIPEFNLNNENKKAPLEVPETLNSKHITPRASKTIIIRRRSRRNGERKLEDSQGFSDSSFINTITSDEIKVDSSPKDICDKNLLNANNNDVESASSSSNTKKKVIVQTTRCIVKTPLDFKTKIADLSLTSDDDDDDEEQINGKSGK